MKRNFSRLVVDAFEYGKHPLLLPLARNPGHLKHIEGIALYSLAKALPNMSCVVEIGSYKGKSACYLAAGLKNKRSVKLVCIDRWDISDALEQFQWYTYRYHDVIEIRRGSSLELSVGMLAPISLLWIDGNHSYEAVRGEIRRYLPLLRRGKYACFHDYWNPCGVRKAVDEVVDEGRLRIERFVDSMAITVKL